MDELVYKENFIVRNNLRRTSEQMSRNEYTRVLSERAQQIENGSPIFVELNSKKNYYPKQIAEMEIKQKKCPLNIYRIYDGNLKEVWSVNEMILPFK